MVPDSLWSRTDCVIRGCLFSCTGLASCPAGWELQAGGNSMCLCLLECSNDSPEGNLGSGQLAYTFVIRIIPCLLLLQVSILVVLSISTQ
jgi:hypothetical protein